MPNYRCNSSDYMNRRGIRQNSASRSMPAPSQESSCPVCSLGRAASDELQGMPIAMAYVPWQVWRNLYDAEKGFCCGTIFEELNKPFRGIGGCQNVR